MTSTDNPEALLVQAAQMYTAWDQLKVTDEAGQVDVEAGAESERLFAEISQLVARWKTVTRSPSTRPAWLRVTGQDQTATQS